jgi:hypothetical protein
MQPSIPANPDKGGPIVDVPQKEHVAAVGSTQQKDTNEKSGRTTGSPSTGELTPEAPKTGVPDKPTGGGSLLSHSDEYKMLREEMMQHIAVLSRTQIWAVVGVGGVYTWLVTHRELVAGPYRYAWFIAPVIMLACALINLELTLRINHIAGYLRRIEDIAFAQNADAPGWEHYKGVRRSSDVFANILGVVLWAAGVLVSCAISWYSLSLPSLPPPSVYPPPNANGMLSNNFVAQQSNLAGTNRMNLFSPTNLPASP